jgi:hypothetical protein
MCPACLRAAGGARAERWKFFTLTIACHERPLPADAIFAYPGCRQPVPARSPCLGPGPAEEARTAALADGAARRRDRGGHRRLEVVRGDRAVGRRRGPGGSRRAGRGPWRGGGVHVLASIRPGQRRSAGPGSRCLAAHQGGAGRRPAGDRGRRQDRPRREGKDGKAPHLVAALAHGIGAVLGQVAVDAKSNEIPAVRELLKAFADLAGG